MPGYFETKEGEEKLIELNKGKTEFHIHSEKFNTQDAAILAEFLKTPQCKLTGLTIGRIEDEAVKRLAEGLKDNTNINYLNLSFGSKMGREGYLAISSALKLRKGLIDVIHINYLSDEGAISLAEGFKVRGVRDLNIGRSSWDREIGNKGIVALAQIKALYFSLSRTECGEEGIIALAEMLKVNQLLELNLNDNKIGFKGIGAFGEALAQNKRLELLNLSENEMGGDEIQKFASGLKNNRSLKILNLSKNKIDSKGVDAFGEALKTNSVLKELYLGGNELGDSEMPAFANMLSTNNYLEKLSVGGNLGSKGMRSIGEGLKNNTKLDELYLEGSEIDDSSMKVFAEALKFNKTLSKLSFSKSKMSPTGRKTFIEGLKINQGLREIDFSGNEIDVNDINALIKILNLNFSIRTLKVSVHNEIIDLKNIEHLNKIRRSTNINLNSLPGYFETGEGKSILYRLDANNKDLDSLSIGGNKTFLENEDMKKLSKSLMNNSIVKSLSISCQKIDVQQATLLAEGLMCNTKIYRLSLDENQIEDEVITIITGIFNFNSTISHLSLNNNKIGINGLNAVAKITHVNSRLSCLELSSNNIDDEGLIIFLESLKTNAIRLLKLSDNKFGSKGVRALFKLLEVNTSLQELTLTCNKLDEEVAMLIVNGLKLNKTLQSLSVHCKEVDPKGVEILGEMFKLNNTLESFYLTIPVSKYDPPSTPYEEIIETKLQFNNAITHMGHQIKSKVIKDLVERNSRHRDMFHQAAKQNNVLLVENVIKKGVNLISTSSDSHAGLYYGNNTALHWAALMGHSEVVSFLVPIMRERGISLDIKNGSGKTAEELTQDPKLINLFESQRRLQQIKCTKDVREAALSNFYKSEALNPLSQTVLEFNEEVLNSTSNQEAHNGQLASPDFKKDNLSSNIKISFFEGALIQVEQALVREQETILDLQSQHTILERQQEKLSEQLDLKDKQIQEAILKCKSTQEALQSSNQANLALLAEQLNAQQQEMDNLKVQHAILWREHQLKEQRKQALERLQKFPNQWQFYRTIQLQIQKLFIRSISGGGDSEGSINASLQGLDFFNDVTNIVPIVGPAINVFIKWTIGKLLESLDETRRLNISDEIADLLTLSELKRMSEGVAQRLTYWYEPILNNFATEAEEKALRKAKASTFLGKAQAVAKKAQQTLTHSKQESSAVKMAKFVIAWGLDAISELELGNVVSDNNNNVILPEKLLENRLVELITHKKLSSVEKADISTVIKLFKQTLKLTEDLVIKLSNFLIKQKVYTKQGEKWPLWRVLAECGMQVKEENQLKIYVVSHAVQMASIFGHCQGTPAAAQARSMTLQLTKSIAVSDNNAENDNNAGFVFSTKANNQQLLTVTLQTNQLEQKVERVQSYTNLTNEKLKRQNEELTTTIQTQGHEIEILKQQQAETLQQVALQQQQIKQLLALLSNPSQQLSQQVQSDDIINASREKVTEQLRK